MTVFISRVLLPGSDFERILHTAGWIIEGRSLVALKSLPVADIPDCDWIFFSSAQAVRFFFNLKGIFDKIPLGVQWAALGPATGQMLQQYIPHVQFIGNGDPGRCSIDFEDWGRHKRVLFPGAKNARREFRQSLARYAQVIELPIYDNQAAPSPAISTANILVFTSPLNALAYFSIHPLLPGQQLIAIGLTTAQTLTEIQQKKVHIATSPTETALAEKVLELGKSLF
jgi:uroporphyrinogen-III synthase